MAQGKFKTSEAERLKAEQSVAELEASMSRAHEMMTDDALTGHGIRLEKEACKSLDDTHRFELLVRASAMAEARARALVTGPVEFTQVVFDPTKWEVWHFVGGARCAVEEGTWAAHGAMSYLRQELQLACNVHPLVGKLPELLSVAGVEVAPPQPRGATAFLGQGGAGRVFRVRPTGAGGRGTTNSTPSMALKLFVRADAAAQAVAEADQLRGASECDAVVDLKAAFAAGLLLAPVGRPLDVTDKAQLQSALAALLRLFAAGHVHGDARVANCVWVADEGRAIWVDLLGRSMAVPDRGQSEVCVDVSLFCASVLGCRSDSLRLLHRDVWSAVLACAVGGATAGDLLVDALWQASSVRNQ